MRRSHPIYYFEVPFAAVLGLRPETLRRYIRLDVVIPDAETTSGRSLFLTDAMSIEGHRASVRSYKTRNARDTQYRGTISCLINPKRLTI
jgi:hypothetical protein